MPGDAVTIADPRFPVPILAETRDILAGPFKLFIDGHWVEGGGTPIVSHDPATGHAIAEVAMGNAVDVDRAVAAARRAFEGPWSRLTGFQRARLLRRLADLIERDAALLAEIETIDNGMPIGIASLTAGMNAELLTYYAGWAERIEGRTTQPPAHILAEAEAFTYTLREPVGVVGQIIPWNVPLSMACLKLGPALAAGCTIVLKPAEETPLSAILLGRLIEEAGFPNGVVNIVNGPGEDVGAALAGHRDVDKISFTGSTEVGRHIVRAAADDLKKVSLELGGKSPVIVFDDADLALAVPGVAMATFFLQGQNCMAGTRIFVQSGIYDSLIAGLASFANGMGIGHGLDPANIVGPLISARQKQRVLGFIDAGKKEGATLVAGGGVPDGPGHFVRPTIFTDVTPGMTIVREEIFGPVMAIERFEGDDVDAVARMANASVYGLSGSVWTTSLAKAHRTAARIRSGHMSVNCHGAVGANIPFGGYKQSGWGREFGAEGMGLYLETKAITVRL